VDSVDINFLRLQRQKPVKIGYSEKAEATGKNVADPTTDSAIIKA
jgi:hypothetical protein